MWAVFERKKQNPWIKKVFKLQVRMNGLLCMWKETFSFNKCLPFVSKDSSFYFSKLVLLWNKTSEVIMVVNHLEFQVKFIQLDCCNKKKSSDAENAGYFLRQNPKIWQILPGFFIDCYWDTITLLLKWL